MDVSTYCKQLEDKMSARISSINPSQEELSKIGEVLEYLQGLMQELKIFMKSYEFKDEDEEIAFFKELKPLLMSQYFYYKKLLDIRLTNSFREREDVKKYKKKVAKSLEKYIRKISGFYRYCVSGQTHLDHLYFTRKQNRLDLNHDETFTTGYDIKLSRLIAIELLKKDVLRKSDFVSKDAPNIKWTASKASLVELIYALQSVGVFNNATANIKDIAEAFQSFFSVDLKGYWRTYTDVRRRKNGEMFVDHLRDKFHQRMDEIDG